MINKKRNKYLMYLITFIVSLGSFFVINQTNNKSSIFDQNGLRTKSISKAESQQVIKLTINDIVANYDGGFKKTNDAINYDNIQSIIVGYKSNDINANEPSTNIYSLNVKQQDNNMIIEPIVDKTKPFNEFFNTNKMESNPDLEKPMNNLSLLSSNYLNLVEYNSSTSIEGKQIINWSKQNPTPLNLTNQIVLNNESCYLLQMSFIGIDNNKVGIYIKNEDNSIIKADAKYNCNNVQNTSIELFFSKSSNGIRLWIPESDCTSIGTWKINNQQNDFISNPIAAKYFNMNIQDAFNQLKQNINDIKSLINWSPIMILPSMQNFGIDLILDQQKNELRFLYGNNNNFKYVFYTSYRGGTQRHIYPFYFDTSSLSQSIYPGAYFNIKSEFENYSKKISIIDGFNKGTYIILGQWEINKQRYASQVSIEEIKQLIFNHIGNKPDGFSLDDIILDSPNANLIFDNANGQITFNIVLKKYQDRNGNSMSNEQGYLIPGSEQIIKGFFTIQPTVFNEEYNKIDIKNNQLIATDQTELDIKNFILKNKDLFFNSLGATIGGPELSINDIKIINYEAFNNKTSEFPDSGSINVQAQLLSNFLTTPYALIATKNDQPFNFNFKIYGFKLLKETVFYQNVKLSTVNDILASEQTDSTIRQLVINNKSLFFTNLPETVDLNNINDFNISIFKASNLSDSNIDNGNSGFIKCNFTIKDYFDTSGTIKHNKQYEITISGFKLITPTKFNQDITINNVQDILVTNIINNNQDIINLIKKNQSLFLNNSSIPVDFFNNLIISKIEISNITNYQISFSVVMNLYYDELGNLINKASNPINIKVKGYKQIIPTSINAGTYTVSKEISSLYPSKIDINLLKKIVFEPATYLMNNSVIIAGSIPNDFNYQTNILISENSIIKNNLKGFIEFELNINYRYNNDNIGAITTNPFNTYSKIRLEGFNFDQPTSVSNTNPLEINSNYPLLINTYAENIKQIVDKVNINLSLTTSEQKILDQFKLFLYDLGFIGYKEPFNVNDISIYKIENINNLTGTLTVTFSLNRYMDNNGDIVSNNKPPLLSTKQITYFKSIVPTRINNSNQIFIITNPNYTKYTAQDIVQGNNFHLLLEIIQNYDQENINQPSQKIILGDLPNNFSYFKNLIISNIEINNITSRITFDLQLNYYFNDYNGNIQVDFPLTTPVRITLSGFKTIPSTTINNQEINSSYFYGENSYSNQTLVLDIQKNSSFKKMTAETFVNMKFTNSNNVNDIMQGLLNQLFCYTNNYYYENTNDLMIVYNPDTSFPMYINGVVINNFNNNTGSINLKVRVTGYYYYRSDNPILITDKNNNYAYMNIKLNNFLPVKVYTNMNSKPYILIILIWSSILVLIIMIISIYVLFIKHKSKNKTSKKNNFILD